jgi:phage nucleotide-binding protein
MEKNMSNILERIKSPSQLVENQGAKLLIYGASGAGKTTTCATAPGKTLIISMEAGLLSIKDADNVTAIEVKEASEIEEIAALLESGQLDYDTVCLDSVTEMSELLLTQEKARSKDPRRAYGEVIEVMTKTMRRFRDLKIHVIFVAKEDKIRDDSTGMFHYQPMMVGTKLPTQIPYFFDEVLCLRTFTEENEEGKKVTNRWLQTTIGDNYIAKDRSGKLDSFEEPNLSYVINKLGFTTKGEDK